MADTNSDIDGTRRFPIAAGILFGLGLGGFFDGIVLDQILQWHHMVTSAGDPADSVRNLQINTLSDGVFHASGAAVLAVGWIMLKRGRRETTGERPTG